MSSKPNWKEVESNHGAHGDIGDVQNVAKKVYDVRLFQRNLRLAEALCLSEEQIDFFQNLRTLMARGKLKEAEELMESAEGEELVELIIEKARLAFFNGHWQDCIDLSTQGLELSPTGVSRLVILNIRSICYFELGQTKQAIQDIEDIKTLAVLYPYIDSSFYGETLRVRVLARTHSTEFARKHLYNSWRNLPRKKQLDFEMLITVLRGEIDLKRLEKKDYKAEALATYLLTKSTGDDLYNSFAQFDWFASNYGQDWQKYTNELEANYNRYPRLKYLMDEVASEVYATETARTVLQSLAHNEFKENELILPDEEFDHLFLKDMNLMIDLKKIKATCLKNADKVRKALVIYSEASMDKKTFFHRVWGDQKYTPHLHDGLIRSMIYRIRKNCKIKININDGIIEGDRVAII